MVGTFTLDTVSFGYCFCSAIGESDALREWVRLGHLVWESQAVQVAEWRLPQRCQDQSEQLQTGAKSQDLIPLVSRMSLATVRYFYLAKSFAFTFILLDLVLTFVLSKNIFYVNLYIFRLPFQIYFEVLCDLHFYFIALFCK